MRPIHTILCSLSTALVLAGPLPALEAPVSTAWLRELQAALTNMGVKLDVDASSRAALLAAVRTFDAHAEIATDATEARIQSDHEGRFLLPGFRLSMTNGLPLVVEVPSNHPAATAGLLPGDLLVGIGTQSFAKTTLPDALAGLKAGDEPSLPVRYVRGATTTRVEIVREFLPEAAIETVELLPNQVGYIKINGLYPGSGRDVVSRVRAWSENARDGVILDLRGAGGADTAAATQIASLFSRGGQFLFAFRDHHHQDIESFRATEGNPVGQPVMVLVDRRTRGAAEVLAAALNGIARNTLLLGEPTAGDFLLRETVPLSGQRIRLAVRVLDTADGIRHNGQHGLEPSIRIGEKERTTRDYEPPVDLLDRRAVLEVEARDAAIRRRVRGDGALERAVDLIVGLKTLNKQPGSVSSEP